MMADRRTSTRDKTVDCSVVDLMGYLGDQIQTRDMDPTTGRAYISAVRRVCSALDRPLGTIDVRTLDLDQLWARFVTSDSARTLEPITLASYRGRVRKAVARYLDAVEGRQASARSVASKPTRRPQQPMMIEYPFPVRPHLQAHLVLPADLTPDEADRIARFVGSLAIEDGGPSSPVNTDDRA